MQAVLNIFMKETKYQFSRPFVFKKSIEMLNWKPMHLRNTMQG